MPRTSNTDKIQRLKELIARLNGGQEVALRDFTIATNLQHRKAFKTLWQEQIEIRRQLKNKPKAITEYEKKLKMALLANGRYEALDSRKASSKQRKMGVKAEGLFEGAIECLSELLAEDENYRQWFDRDIVFGAYGNIDINPEQMPRVITSKSFDNLSKDGARNNFGLKTKDELKIKILEQALAELTFEMASDTEKAKIEVKEQQQSIKLKEMLKDLKARR